MKVETNLYRDGKAWCHATWVDGDFDSSDPLDVLDSATEAEAEEAVRQAYSHASSHVVRRVDDVDTSR